MCSFMEPHEDVLEISGTAVLLCKKCACEHMKIVSEKKEVCFVVAIVV